MSKWDVRFLDMAKLISTWSKDPSTKVGAVIVDSDRRIISAGFNGFPKYVEDALERYNDRELKLKMVCHAERNAILFAKQDLAGCILYTTMYPCATCAGMIIQSGLSCVVYPPIPPNFYDRWKTDIEATKMMFKEAGVHNHCYEG